MAKELQNWQSRGIMNTKWLQALIDDRLNMIRENRAELERLKQAGRIYATPSYKAGKYLYLIYPTQDDGSRKREYVGADPVKIREALDLIENARRYEELKAETDEIENLMVITERRIKDIENSLERVAPLDLVTKAAHQAQDPSPSVTTEIDDSDELKPNLAVTNPENLMTGQASLELNLSTNQAMR